jgi:hypothetical protein
MNATTMRRADYVSIRLDSHALASGRQRVQIFHDLAQLVARFAICEAR